MRVDFRGTWEWCAKSLKRYFYDIEKMEDKK